MNLSLSAKWRDSLEKAMKTNDIENVGWTASEKKSTYSFERNGAS